MLIIGTIQFHPLVSFSAVMSWTVRPIFTKIGPDHLQMVFGPPNCFWITRECIRRRVRQNRCEAISPQRFSVSRRILVRVIASMTWGYVPSFGTAPPAGLEILNYICAYNFWTVCPNVIKLECFESVRYFSSAFFQQKYVNILKNQDTLIGDAKWLKILLISEKKVSKLNEFLLETRTNFFRNDQKYQ